MANWTAIAAVTATLEATVRASMAGKVTPVAITTGRPRVFSGPSATNATVNIFLYAVSPDPNYRNEELSVRGSSGELIDQPVLAVDLFYLISFLGEQDTFAPDLLAGALLTDFHAAPYLTGQRIADAVDAKLLVRPDAFSSARPDLDRQEHRIRVTPMRLSMEEMTNLWSALGTDFSTTIALEVGVLLLEPDLDPKPTSALPVLERVVHTHPTTGPEIDEIRPMFLEFDAAATFTVVGSGFDAPDLIVSVGGFDAGPTVISPNELAVELPAGVRAGFQPVRVIQQLEMGDPPELRDIFESGTSVVIVRPRIEITGTIAGGDAAVAIDPPTGPDQDVRILLNRTGAGERASDEREVLMPADLSLGAGSLLAGEYTVRVRVDGAESLVDPTTTVTVP